eukprot:TRINITY_DN6997_c0_g2_i3.p1 TRINITY_DN6997_c0_g2~~TRINITY_DN6997_c0_g2_i3.p1  ORF type:complete len:460 (-),score=105.78 TRINITY_DN6997_c0_g2_i3:83-1315(-)
MLRSLVGSEMCIRDRSMTLLPLLPLLATALADMPAPEYTLDLDLPPSQRWQHIMRSQMSLHGGYNHTFGPLVEFAQHIIPAETWRKYDLELQAAALPFVGDEVTEELSGIQILARELGYEVQLSLLQWFQIFYELMMQCTGVLVRASADGAILHGRNMDIGLPLENITTTVHWTRAGETVMTSTQFLGYVGLHTGMRRSNSNLSAGAGWSAQVNERIVLAAGPVIGYQKGILLATVAGLLDGGRIVGRYLRDAMLSAPSFKDALGVLASNKLASPMYVIVGGAKGEGAVLTRGRDGLATVAQDTSVVGRAMLQDRQPSTQDAERMLGSGDWYMTQTNWDSWLNTTHASCASVIAGLAPWELKACDEYHKIVYEASCADLCQLYSDGRREKAIELLEAGGRSNATLSLIHI